MRARGPMAQSAETLMNVLKSNRVLMAGPVLTTRMTGDTLASVPLNFLVKTVN